MSYGESVKNLRISKSFRMGKNFVKNFSNPKINVIFAYVKGRRSEVVLRVLKTCIIEIVFVWKKQSVKNFSMSILFLTFAYVNETTKGDSIKRG